jgi:drug/metabolite transporter (DMT)-like permease
MSAHTALAFGFAVAVLAAVLDGAATVLQARAARRSTSTLLRRGLLYAAGLSIDVLGWGLAVVALRFLPVFAVQAIVAGQTAITVLLAHAVLRSPIRAVDLLGIGATGVGLGVLAAGAAGTVGRSAPHQAVLAVLLGLLVVLVVAALVATRHGTVVRSVVAGLAYGGSTLAVRALMLQPGATDNITALLAHPLTYVVLGFAAIGVPLYAAALRHSTPTVASAIVTMIEVVFPGTLAIALLGDRIRPGWWWSSAAGLIIAVLGVTALVIRETRSPHNSLTQDRPAVGSPSTRGDESHQPRSSESHEGRGPPVPTDL